MNQLQTLSSALCELLKQIEGTDIRLVIGGGFGIYLKVDHVRKLNVRTLIDPEFWPEARSTNDVDLFLRPELLMDSTKLKPLAQAIYELDYKPVPGAEKYQFIKTAGEETGTAKLKIDILTGPRDAFAKTRAHVDARRVRPKPSVGLHAHPVDEAVSLERELLPVVISSLLRTGEQWSGQVFLPNPFTFAMMKLFAFRDRLQRDPDQAKAEYHALDVYSILATTTEPEWAQALVLRDKFHRHPFVIEAGRIAHEFFGRPEQMGLIRLRESRYYRSDFKLGDFSSSLLELFRNIPS
jgi:hypothetical protein